jgi:hypothetical protein
LRQEERLRRKVRVVVDFERDGKQLGARINITTVCHIWSSAMTHHPHIHLSVPGGGLSQDVSSWISSRPALLLPVRVLGKPFRRLFLTFLHQRQTRAPPVPALLSGIQAS